MVIKLHEGPQGHWVTLHATNGKAVATSKTWSKKADVNAAAKALRAAFKEAGITVRDEKAV